jgi:predicted metalloendopeptidase
MSGQHEQKARWKRVLDTINGTHGRSPGPDLRQAGVPGGIQAAMKELVGNLR